MKRGSLCAVDVDISKSKIQPDSLRELQFSCEEVEALYAIGFQKVNDHCKDEPVMTKYDVDWGSCLTAYYPWVQLLHTKICIMKSEADLEFLACYCSADSRGNISNRGFCITKVECLMNGQGINIENASELEVEETCLSHIQYFLEANTNDRNWFSKAQKNDKLRVRAPYHQDSPCYNENFSGLFDIGQLDFVDLTNGKMDVLSPFLVPENKKVMEKLREDVGGLGVDGAVEYIESSPTRDRMDKLSFFFEERILANFLIWIPGIVLVYSAWLKERGKFLKIFIYILQFVIVTFGLYNVSVPFLPESFYDVLPQSRTVQLQLVSVLFLVAPTLCSDNCEMTEYFLKISLASIIPDIALWKVVNLMYTEQRIENFKIFTRLWFVLISYLSLYNILVYLKTTYFTPPRSPEVLKRSNSKKKKENKKVPKLPNVEAQAATKSPVQKKRSQKGKKVKEENIFSILCQYKCDGILNIGYVSVNCTETCFNQFHLQCWSSFLKVELQQPETCLLGQACLTHTCSGRIFEIVWVDKYGKETARKDNYAHLATVKKEVKQKGRNKSTKALLSRTFSEGSGGSSEEKSGGARQGAASQARTDVTTRGQTVNCRPVRTFETSYASMVKNSKNNNNNSVVDQILELNCPEYFNQNCQMTEKSKILSLINKSKEEQTGGVKTKLYSSSSAIIFVPGAPPYSPPPAGQNVNKIQPTVNLGNTEHVQVKARKAAALDVNLLSGVSSLTRIMAKHFASYSLLEVDVAVKEVLATVRLEDVTIPEFRALIGKKLEQTNVNDSDNEIYMSDDDEGSDADDECPICTELLKQETCSLQPCGHVFHLKCIKEWLKKDLSCPKCRAVVKKFSE